MKWTLISPLDSTRHGQIEKRRQSLYIEALPPIAGPQIQFNANGFPMKPGESPNGAGAASSSSSAMTPGGTSTPGHVNGAQTPAAVSTSRVGAMEWSSVSTLKDTINAKPLCLLKAEEMGNYRQVSHRTVND